MTAKAGSMKTMAELHEQLTQTLLEIVKGGAVVEIVDEDTGEITHQKVTPDKAYLNIARQFLKDNNIEADLGASEDGKALTEELPFDEDDHPDNVHPINKVGNG